MYELEDLVYKFEEDKDKLNNLSTDFIIKSLN